MSDAIRPRASFAIVALSALLTAGRARAQDAKSLSVAQALYTQAVKEMAARSYATACPKLEEAVRLVPEGVGGKLTLAECYEAWGKLASAWTEYQLAEAMAARLGQADRKKLAHERAAALEPKLATLTVVVEGPARTVPGLAIKRDGVLVGPAQWGLALPIDKGRHLITASVGDGRKWEKVVDIGADGARETVGIGDLPGAPKAAPPPSPVVTPPVTTPPPPPEPPPSSARRTVGIAMGSAGLAGILIGSALGVTAIVKKSQSNADGHCDAQSHCDPTGTDLRNASLRAGDWSTAMFIGGAVALAGGVVLFATSPAPAPRASARLVVLPGGAAISGSF